MKTKSLPMGLLKIQAETLDESQVVSGIIEMLFHFRIGDAVANYHGCRKIGKQYLNWCLVPDGSLTGTCHEKHKPGEGCDCLKPGIETNIKHWRKLPALYDFEQNEEKPRSRGTR